MISFRVLVAVCCLVVAVNATKLPIRGGVKELEGEKLTEAEETLKESLTKLATGDGPHYKISKIHSATYQTVNGSLYRLTADLTEEKTIVTKKCDVSIWIHIEGHQVTLECEGAEKLVKEL